MAVSGRGEVRDTQECVSWSPSWILGRLIEANEDGSLGAAGFSAVSRVMAIMCRLGAPRIKLSATERLAGLNRTRLREVIERPEVSRYLSVERVGGLFWIKPVIRDGETPYWAAANGDGAAL
ncbi:hypothetical protein [Falsiroseomonas sp. CW058]|uniref:hypothetical protein n=1 Tax=Falsiroseomonas sp. CW058 TaxID=3388664 RepID=UPI003D311A8A